MRILGRSERLGSGMILPSVWTATFYFTEWATEQEFGRWQALAHGPSRSYATLQETMSEKVNDTTMFVQAARPTRRSWANEVMAALLVLLSPALVAGVFLVGFHDQDRSFLQANPVAVTQDLGEGVRRILDLNSVDNNAPHGWYAPLAQLTTGLQYRLHGPVAWPFRLVNVLLHIATAWFLYRIILGLMPRGAPLSAAEEPVNADAPFNAGRCVVASFGALFFFLHPANVESLAWVSQRGCAQAGFFGVLAWWLITRQGPERKSWRCLATPSWTCYGLSLLCLVLAVLSHPMACAAAGVLALTECVWVREDTARRWLRTAGFVVAGVIFASLAAKTGLWTKVSGNELPLSVLVILGRSLLGLLVPTMLSSTYTFVPPTGPEDVGIWVAVGLVLLVVILPVWLPVGVRPACVLLPGFSLMLLPWLVPGMGLDATGNQGLCLALPIMGVMVGLGVEALQYRLRFIGKEGGKIGETVGVGLAVLLFLLLGVLSVARSFAFADDESLLRDAASKQPLSYTANLELAEKIVQRARQASEGDARPLWKEAQQHLQALRHAVDRQRFTDSVRQGMLEGEVELRLGLEDAEKRLREMQKLAGPNHPLTPRIGELLAEIDAAKLRNQGTDAGTPPAP